MIMKTDFKIRLDRDWYPRNNEIYTWLRENIGSMYVDLPKYWCDTTFGYTTVEFRREEDFKKFKEHFGLGD
jgi:hypothetical protein